MMRTISNPYGLTDLKWRFVQEYLIDLNGTAAYQRAGYRAQGDSARAAAARLLADVNVETAIAQERKRLSAKLEITTERVLQEYARLAFSDMRNYSAWNANGVRLFDSEQLTEDQSRAVAEVIEETTIISRGKDTETIIKKRLKLHDKKGALDSLSKHLGIFKDDSEKPMDLHIHVHTARERVHDRLSLIAKRHAETAVNGH